MEKKKLVIDGDTFDSLTGFYKAVNNLLSTEDWGNNLDALNDVLSGGYGTPAEGFILEWKNFGKSKEVLGKLETLQWLMASLKKAHPSNLHVLNERIELSKVGKGEMLWMTIVDIITSHEDIELRLS